LLPPENLWLPLIEFIKVKPKPTPTVLQNTSRVHRANHSTDGQNVAGVLNAKVLSCARQVTGKKSPAWCNSTCFFGAPKWDDTCMISIVLLTLSSIEKDSVESWVIQEAPLPADVGDVGDWHRRCSIGRTRRDAFTPCNFLVRSRPVGPVNWRWRRLNAQRGTKRRDSFISRPAVENERAIGQSRRRRSDRIEENSFGRKMWPSLLDPWMLGLIVLTLDGAFVWFFTKCCLA
jgi:hypothetical protein